MAGGLKRIQFLSEGFESILNGSGVESVVASTARSQARAKEKETGSSYRVWRMTRATSRVVYIASPVYDDSRVAGLDHETWMSEVWPRVGGPAWRS